MIDQELIRLATRLAITQAAQKRFPDSNMNVFQLGIIAGHQMNHTPISSLVKSLMQRGNRRGIYPNLRRSKFSILQRSSY